MVFNTVLDCRQFPNPLFFKNYLDAMRFLTTSILICFLMAFQSCYADEARDQADQAIEQVNIFRKNLAAHQYIEIYNQSSDNLKKSVSKYEFIKFLGDASEKFGAFNSANLQQTTIMRWFMVGAPIIKLTYFSKYSNATMHEYFTFITEDNKTVLLSYSIKGKIISNDEREKINIAKQAVADIRNKIAAHQYIELYKSSSRRMQNIMSEDAFMKFMNGASKDLGPLRSATLTNEEFIAKDKRIVLTYNSDYWNITTDEYFVFLIEDDKVVFGGYQYTKD